jgi:adenosylcobinamide-GDP ribazoletransferase
MKGLITAIQTLTILPIRGKGCEDFAESLPWFPLVGLLLGSILTGLAYAGRMVQPEAMAVLLLIASVLLTRGFHLDGVADCADGFGGGYSRERVLAIMKDSSTGAFGAIALILLLLTKWVALTHLLQTGNVEILLIAYAGSRALQVEQMVRLPYARQTGTAASFVQGATTRHRLIALVSAGVIAILLKGILGLIYLSLAWIAAFLFGAYCRKRVGGITGDLLGATSELTETLILFLPFFL